MTARPRILVVGPFPPAVGGVARTLDLILRAALVQRFEVIPLTTAKRQARDVPHRPTWKSVPYALHHATRLLAQISKYRPQVVYLKATSDTGFLRDLLLIRLAALAGVPVLVHLHGRAEGGVFASDAGGVAQLARWGMQGAAGVVVNSPGLARSFTPLFPGKPLVVVPNMVELDAWAPLPARETSRPLRVLTVGRLSREKGTWDLLEVAARVTAASPDVEFRLCGQGETAQEEAALRDAAARAGLAERVRFLGLVPEADLRREYGAAHCFFLPTHAEIFPVVLLEALAAGLPLVTTDVAAIPELFTSGAEGFQHAVGDVEGMAGSLLRLAGEPELRARFSVAARALAERRYDVDRNAARVADLLADLAAGRPLASVMAFPDALPGAS